MGWPLLVVDGVEADDVIGTLACEAAAGVRTVISTGDKDMAQLVNPQVTLVNTMSNETLDEAGVEKKFGVKPERIVDYLALIGDAVDNVPGVDKVGPKTAVKWLTQYRTLDDVIRHAGEIDGVVGENLRKSARLAAAGARAPDDQMRRQAAGQARRPRAYSARHGEACRAVRSLRIQDLAAGAAAERKRRERSAVRRIARMRGRSSPTASTSRRHYETILTEQQLDRVARKNLPRRFVSVDTETTSLDPLQARLVGISFSIEPGHAAYLPLAHRYAGAPQQLDLDAVLARLRPWLEDAHRPKLGQNLKYDKHVLANHGVRLAGIAHDTLLESYVLESAQAARHGQPGLAPSERARPSSFRMCAARAPTRSASIRSASSARPNIRRRTRISRCSCITRFIRVSRMTRR